MIALVIDLAGKSKDADDFVTGVLILDLGLGIAVLLPLTGVKLARMFTKWIKLIGKDGKNNVFPSVSMKFEMSNLE